MNCPCGLNKLAEDCCLPIINGKKNAHTAEQLMRSRYTAFTIAEVDYLMSSHHSKTRNMKDKKEIKRWAKSVQWMGLSILDKEKGTASDTSGIVEFKAVFMENGQLDQIHEKSYFEKENNLWVYKNAIPHSNIKI